MGYIYIQNLMDFPHISFNNEHEINQIKLNRWLYGVGW